MCFAASFHSNVLTPVFRIPTSCLHFFQGKRTAWLAIFYLTIPVGTAAGYIYGGIVGVLLGWRWAFFIESLFMIPFILLCAFGPPIPLKGGVETNPPELPSPSISSSGSEYEETREEAEGHVCP